MLRVLIYLICYFQFQFSLTVNGKSNNSILSNTPNETLKVETRDSDDIKFLSSDVAFIRDKLLAEISDTASIHPFTIKSNRDMRNLQKDFDFIEVEKKKKDNEPSGDDGETFLSLIFLSKVYIKPKIQKRSYYNERIFPIVTPVPENVPSQIPKPDLQFKNFKRVVPSVQSVPVNSEVYKHFVNTMSQAEQSLMKSLSNHNINEKSCSFSGMNRQACMELRQISSLFWNPPFVVDSRTSVKSFVKADYMDFYLNSASLIDIWNNHINAGSTLDFDIVDTKYEELIHFYNSKPDPNFVLPKMSLYLQNDFYPINQGHMESLNSNKFIKKGPLYSGDFSLENDDDYYDSVGYSSETLNPELRTLDDHNSYSPHLSNLTVITPEIKHVKPRIVFHAPPEFPTDVFVKAMSNALPTVLKKTVTESNNQVYGLYKNLPFGAAKEEKGLEEKIKESLKTLMLLTTPSPQFPFQSSLPTFTVSSNLPKETTTSRPTTTPTTAATTTKPPKISVITAATPKIPLTPIALLHHVVTPLSKVKDYSTSLYDGFQLPSSLIIPSTDTIIPPSSSIRFINTSFHDLNAVDFSNDFAVRTDDTKVVIRLKSPNNGQVSREIAIPSSKFNKDGITEIKLDNGKKLRVRIKGNNDRVINPVLPPYRPIPQRFYEQRRRKPTSHTHPGGFHKILHGTVHGMFDKFDKGNSIFTDLITGNVESAFHSASSFVKDMFDDINTYKYYDNLLTVVALASFLGFLYSRGIAIANSISPLLNSGLGKTESWLADIQTREDISGVEKIINSIRGAFEKWGLWGNDNKNDTEDEESGRFFHSRHSSHIRRLRNILNDIMEKTGEKFLIQMEVVSKLSVFLIDVATKAYKRKREEDGDSCLSRPACELNEESLSVGGVSALVLPIISTMIPATINPPKDSFSILELFRPIWLSSKEGNCHKIPKCEHSR